jgi:hypothetical protein
MFYFCHRIVTLCVVCFGGRGSEWCPPGRRRAAAVGRRSGSAAMYAMTVLGMRGEFLARLLSKTRNLRGG